MPPPGNTPIAIDFLSNPDAAIAALRKVEVALMRLDSRVGGLGVSFQLLNRGLPTGQITSQIDMMNRRMQAMTNQVEAATRAFLSMGVATRGVRIAQAGGGGGVAGAGEGGDTTIMPFLGRNLARVAGVAAIGTGLVMATKAAMSFEKAMAGVAAVGEIDRTSEAFRRLTEAARGGSLQFGATEKAMGLRELVAAGMTAEEATASLANTLQLATAGEIAMGRAAEIMVASMSAFGFTAKDTAKVVDTLTAAANASPASIEDMGEAMKFIAPVASALKVSIQDTSAALAILANNGIRGGLAGRGLGAVLARLVAPSKDAVEVLDELGVSADLLNPTLNSLSSVLNRFSGLTQEALVKLFGAENLDVSNILKANASAFGEMSRRMNDSAGAGERFAATIADTTSGSLKQLKSQLELTGSEIGKFGRGILEGATPILLKFLSTVESVVKSLRSIDAADIGAMPGIEDFTEQINQATTQEQLDEVTRSIYDFIVGMKKLDELAEDSPFAKLHSKANLEPFFDLLQRAQEMFEGREQQRALERQASEEAEIYRKRGEAMMEAAEKARQAQDIFAGPKQDFTTLSDEEQEAARKEAMEVLRRRGDAEEELLRIEEKRKEIIKSIEAMEARAAGATDRADRLEREVEILREKKRLMEELRMNEEEAELLAKRLVTAKEAEKKKDKDKLDIITDSLQAVGGGGRFFAPVPKLTATPPGGTTAPAEQVPPLLNRQIALLEKIETNTGKGGIINATIAA